MSTARRGSAPATDLESNARDRLFVGSLEKGILVLQAFRDAEGPLGLTEIAGLTGLGKSAVQRFCHTLVAMGYLLRDPRTRRLQPSPRLLDFSYMYLHGDSFIQMASPFLIRTHEECHEAMNLARRLDQDVIYVVRLPSLSARLTSPLVGGRAPMFCTASGRSILATLSDGDVEEVLDNSDLSPLTPMTITDRNVILEKVEAARRDGFTIAYQECFVGEIAIAAPVLGRDRRAIGAVNICTSTPAWTVDEVREKLVLPVTRTARDISRALGLSSSA